MGRKQNLIADQFDHSDLTFKKREGAIASLTPREREVSMLVAEKGLTNKQIGAELFISPTTVRHHLHSIFGKLGISSRFELIVLCFRHRLVVPFEIPLSARPPIDR